MGQIIVAKIKLVYDEFGTIIINSKLWKNTKGKWLNDQVYSDDTKVWRCIETKR